VAAYTTVRIAIALAMDSIRVSICGGSLVAQRLSAYDHRVAFGLLALIGGRMVYEALHPHCDPSINLSKWQC
jgi:putative Mn2+ efflux pump MntP